MKFFSAMLAAVMSSQVFYDNKKMFKGEQDARISNLLKLGKDQIHRLKENRVGPANMTLD